MKNRKTNNALAVLLLIAAASVIGCGYILFDIVNERVESFKILTDKQRANIGKSNGE